MNVRRIYQRLIGIIIFLAISLYVTSIYGKSKNREDTAETHLLQQVRNAFNQNNEQRFYEVMAQYRNYLLEKDNISGWNSAVTYTSSTRPHNCEALSIHYAVTFLWLISILKKL